MQQSGTPYLPGKAPVRFPKVQELPLEDTPGISYYVVKDNSGNSVTKTEGQLSDTERAALSRGGTAVGGKTDFANNPAAYSSITLDKDAKEIRVKVPDSIVQNETFQNTLKPALKTILQNYKLNPDYKYALMANSDETKTSEEWIDDINGSLGDLVNETINIETIKKQVADEDGVSLSDEDVIKMRAIALDYTDATGQTIKVNDDTMQALPEKIRSLNVFKNLEGYDEDTHTVRLGDLMKAWNRGEIGERGLASDDDFRQVFEAVDEYFQKRDFSDPSEYAEMVAFRAFMEGKDPDAGFLQGVTDVVSSAFVGLITGAAQFDTDLMNAVEGVFNIAGRVGSDLGALASGKEPGKNVNELNFIRDFVAPELEQWKDNYKTDAMRLNDAKGVTYGLVSQITPLLMQISLGNALGKAAAGLVSDFATGIVSDALGGAKTAQALIYSDITKATPEQIVTALKVGTDLSLSLMKPAQLTNVVGASISILKHSGTILNAATTVVDLGAQVVIDVVCSDSAKLREFLDGDGTEEDKAYIMEQVAGNVAGWAAGVILPKVITAVGKTDIARVGNAVISPKIYATKSWIGQKVDDLKTALHGGDVDWLDAKYQKALEAAKNDPTNLSLNNRAARLGTQAQELAGRRIIRAAESQVGQLDGPFKGARSWDEVVENATRIKGEMVDKIAAANRFVDISYRNNVSTRVARILVDNPTLYSAESGYLDALKKVLSAEAADGIRGSERMYEAGDIVISTLSKETNTYVNAIYRYNEALAYEEAFRKGKLSDGNLLKRVKEEKEYWQKVIKDFRDTHSEELVLAANNLEEAARKFSSATQDARVYEGVLNEETLAAQRGSGFFDRGYMRQQHVDTWKRMKQGGEINFGELRGQQSLEWGFKDGEPKEFQDISVVLFDDVNQVARQSIRKEQIEILKGLGQKVDLVVDGDDVLISRNVTDKTIKAVNKRVSVLNSTFIKDNEGSIFNDVVLEKYGEARIAAQEKATMLSGGKVAATRAKEMKLSDRKIRSVLNDPLVFDDIDMRALVNDKFGKPLNYLTKQEFDDFIGKAPESVRKQIRRLSRQVYSDIYGDFSKSDLPKIRTSDFTEATGLKYKDAGPMKPFLSKNGKPLGDNSWAEVFEQAGMFQFSDVNGGGGFAGDADTILEFYDSILSRPAAVRDLSYDDFINVASLEADTLNRYIVASDYDGIWKSTGLDNYVADLTKERQIFDAETMYKENIEKLESLKKQYDLDAMSTNLNGALDDIIDDVIDKNIGNADLRKTIGYIDDSDDAVAYVTLKDMSDKKNMKKLKTQFHDKAKKQYNEILTSRAQRLADDEYAKVLAKDGEAAAQKARKAVISSRSKNIDRLSNQWANEAADWLEERVMQRYGEVSGRLIDSGSEIVDYDDWFGKVGEINDEIAGASKDATVVKTYNAYGVEEYVRLSPTVANMITTMPPALRTGRFGKLQQAFSRTFRLGNTGGLVPGSLVRQLFRDTGNAMVMGDAWLSNADSIRYLEEFGETAGEWMQKEMPDLWKSIMAESQDTGETFGQVFARREAARGAANVEAELESQLYRFTRNERVARGTDGIYDSSVFRNMRNKTENFLGKTEKLNNMRETYLRERVYNNNLVKGLEEGLTLSQARRYAEFLQAEATTNFGRATYHLANLSRTTPYLASAINGSKSFWRLYAFDPVGVTTRLVGGYVVPAIALTNLSLSNDENRRIYKQIPEYEKENNLVFVVDGQILSIPVPQEISSFVRPIQSMVESMQNANDHSFDELLLNDLVGFSPLDLEGFINIDADRMLEGDIVSQHLIPGAAKISSQLMPPLVKSGFMAVTGVDPYTMKEIDTSYTTIDPETGNKVVIDYKSGELAKKISALFGDNVSAPMAQAILQNLIGKNNIKILDSVIGLAEGVSTGDWPGFGSSLLSEASGITDPLIIERYGEKSNIAWNRAVSKLYEEKEALLSDDEYKKDLQSLSKDDLTADARKKILARIESRREEYRERVLTAAQNLVSEYSGTFDRNKFASVISLMNFNDGTNQYTDNAYSTYINGQQFQVNRAAAVETMARMGFSSPNDLSIFGYYKQNDDGSVEVAYSSPLQVLNYELADSMQDKISLANIRNIVNENNLYDRHESITKQINAIHNSKTKLSNSDYNQIDAIKTNWNAEVFAALAPYVSQMTPEAALNNKQVRDYLYTYIEVPGSWETNNKGRYVSLGDKGNKKAAYYESWLRAMFDISDPYKK